MPCSDSRLPVALTSACPCFMSASARSGAPSLHHKPPATAGSVQPTPLRQGGDLSQGGGEGVCGTTPSPALSFSGESEMVWGLCPMGRNSWIENRKKLPFFQLPTQQRNDLNFLWLFSAGEKRPAACPMHERSETQEKGGWSWQRWRGEQWGHWHHAGD